MKKYINHHNLLWDFMKKQQKKNQTHQLNSLLLE